MTTHEKRIHYLAQILGLDPAHVHRTLDTAARTLISVQRVTGFTNDQLRQFLGDDRNYNAIIADMAMHQAGRHQDAQLLMDVHKAADPSAQCPVIRPGIGTLPQYHNHPHVQQAVRILTAAGLPPLRTDGTRELAPGFQLEPGDEDNLPGWIFIQPDPYADTRTGVAGGRHGYLAVMRWAGWGINTATLPDGQLAVLHPDHFHTPFPG